MTNIPWTTATLYLALPVCSDNNGQNQAQCILLETITPGDDL